MVRKFVAERAGLIAGDQDLDDLLAGHLGNVDRRSAGRAIVSARERLAGIARLLG